MDKLDDLIAGFDRIERDKPSKAPVVFYNQPNDSYEIYASREERVAERINSLFSVFVAKSDRSRVLGIAIKNIGTHFGKQSPLHFFVNAGRAKVGVLVRGAQLSEVYLYKRVEPVGEKAALVEKVVEQFGEVEVQLEPVGAGSE